MAFRCSGLKSAPVDAFPNLDEADRLVILLLLYSVAPRLGNAVPGANHMADSQQSLP
jgi:hypothetical protein